MQDKKLKSQLSAREDVYRQSAKAAAKAEKVNCFIVYSCNNRLTFTHTSTTFNSHCFFYRERRISFDYLTSNIDGLAS